MAVSRNIHFIKKSPKNGTVKKKEVAPSYKTKKFICLDSVTLCVCFLVPSMISTGSLHDHLC